LYEVALVGADQERFTVLELPFNGVAVTTGHAGAVVNEYAPDWVSPPGPVAATMSWYVVPLVKPVTVALVTSRAVVALETPLRYTVNPVVGPAAAALPADHTHVTLD
jgi:hypothetical protein